ncbi:MAG: hypothetical protein DRP34_03650 [Thermodesulfobacteriota bacterium]|nr:MAG: hypothetical protein DRP34_03650 [Thermodesulfobacteriota bacterium]
MNKKEIKENNKERIEIKKICKLRQNMIEIFSLMIEVIEKDENSLNYIKDKLVSLKEILAFENKENFRWGINFIKETLKRRIELLENKK